MFSKKTDDKGVNLVYGTIGREYLQFDLRTKMSINF